MSRRNLRAALALAAMCIVACGSPPPSAVDEELLFVDLEACARGDAECVRSGSVAGAELLVEGNHAVVMWARPDCGTATCDSRTQDCCASSMTCVAKGACGGALIAPGPAKLSLPIRRHSDDARLAWVAFGLAAGEPVRQLRVSIDGEETVLEPAEGWARIEVSGRDRRLPATARLELTATRGVFGIGWIIGRWKR